MTTATQSAPTNATPAKPEKVKLPTLTHMHETQASMEAEVKRGRAAGHKAKKTRKFGVEVGDRSVFVIASSKKDLFGRLGIGGYLKDVKVTEYDPPARQSAESISTADALLSVFNHLPEAEMKKVKEALARKK